MAEVLGIVASLIAVAQVSGSIASLCWNYQNHARNASKELEVFSSEIRSFRDVVEKLVVVLKQDPSRLPAIELLGRTDGPLDSCHAELKELERKLQVDESSKTTKMLKALRWPFNEGDVLKRLSRLNRFKTTLNFALLVDQTNIAMTIHNATQSIMKDSVELKDDLNSLRNQRYIDDLLTYWLEVPKASSKHSTICQRRHPKTGLWLMVDEKYELWKSNSSSMLWLHGISGSGKTVLCSLVIEDISKTCQIEQGSVLVFVYFDSSDAGEELYKKFLCSVIAQFIRKSEAASNLLISLSHNPKHEGSFARTKSPPSISDLEEILRMIVETFNSVYLVVDALDECTSSNQLLDFIGELFDFKLKNIRILITSRNDGELGQRLHDLSTHQIDLHNNAVVVDIQLYIKGTLQSNHRLKRWSKEVHHDIEECLLKGAQGMFRWVECQFFELQTCSRVKDIKKVLSGLPKSLNETYERTLSRINSERVIDITRLLQWLVFAERVVCLDEIMEALAIDYNDGGDDNDLICFDPDNRLLDAWEILSQCSSLITLSVPRSYGSSVEIRLSHASVKEYLTSGFNHKCGPPPQAFEKNLAHKFIAQTCLEYLSYFDRFSDLDEIVAEDFPLANYASRYWATHVRNATFSEHLQRLCLNLLQRSKNQYQFWLHLYNPDKPWKTREGKSDALPPLYCTSLLGMDKLVPILIDNGEDIEERGGLFFNALSAAAFGGHEFAVQQLLLRGADPNKQGGIFHTPIAAAVAGHHESIVRILLQYGACAMARHPFPNWNELVRAAGTGQAGIVQLLIEFGAEVDKWCGKPGTNALLEAAKNGHLPVVKVLVSAGATVYTHAIEEAVRRGYLEIAKFLCTKGAKNDVMFLKAASQAVDVNNDDGGEQSPKIALLEALRAGHTQGTPLKEAIQTNRVNLVQLLLDFGADVNGHFKLRYSKEDMFPLQLAAMQAKFEICQKLLEHGANVHEQSYHRNWTALHAAAEGGDIRIGQRLVEDFHAPMEAKLINGSLPIHVAAQYGNAAYVQLFLEKGVNVNVTNAAGRTPLHTAAAYGHKDVMELLIANGVAVDAQEENGMAALDLTELKLKEWNSDKERERLEYVAMVLRSRAGKGGGFSEIITSWCR